MSKIIPVLTIDGPSGSGKGTIARLLAQHFGWHLLDSGAIYRVLALHVLQNNYALDDVANIERLAQQLPVEFKAEAVYLTAKDVTHEIRTEICSATASKIAALEPVRAALLARQRGFSKLPGLVADGRDMGTVVFPQAFFKVYLDASAEERAQRRYLQLKDGGYNVNLADLVVEIQQRDERDKTRAVAPLRPADDALIIDNSALSITEVFQLVVTEAEQRLSKI